MAARGRCRPKVRVRKGENEEGNPDRHLSIIVKRTQRNNAGFTLIELMIVVAIIAIIASVAIPKLLSARLAANESAAISTLRSISSAQAQLQSSAAIDTDSDGGGEYGYFGELAGTVAVRIDDGSGAPTVTGSTPLVPAMLSTALGNVQASVVIRSGYVFQIWLPQAGAAPTGTAEAATGGMGTTAPDPNNCEVFWCAYAWPLDVGSTGNRAFFINQDGDILQYNNRGTNVYEGAAAGPAFDAAFTTASDMSSPMANAGAGLNANDGEVWAVVQ